VLFQSLTVNLWVLLESAVKSFPMAMVLVVALVLTPLTVPISIAVEVLPTVIQANVSILAALDQLFLALRAAGAVPCLATIASLVSSALVMTVLKVTVSQLAYQRLAYQRTLLLALVKGAVVASWVPLNASPIVPVCSTSLFCQVRQVSAERYSPMVTSLVED